MLVLGRLRVVPVLALSHFLIAMVALLGTAVHSELAKSDPLATLKFIDALVRAPIVMTMAASISDPERTGRRIAILLTGLAIVFCVLAILERFQPGNSFVQWLAEVYGGPPYPHIGLNHKQICLEQNRATAVFIVAPSLAMATVLLIVFALMADRDLLGRWRWIMLTSAFVAGSLSNSKSFVLGIPLVGLLLVPNMFRWTGWLRVVPLGMLCIGAWLYVSPGLPINPLTDIGEAQDPLWLLTSGRFARDESIMWVSRRVLQESPFFGYGFGQNPALTYADSAVNRYMLYAGIPGLLLAFFGFGAQAYWFLRSRAVSTWRDMGWSSVVVAMSFFLTGAFLQMPRINDLFAVIVGVCVAMTRQTARPEAVAVPDVRSGARRPDHILSPRT
jgi:hypothetical protein